MLLNLTYLLYYIDTSGRVALLRNGVSDCCLKEILNEEEECFISCIEGEGGSKCVHPALYP